MPRRMREIGVNSKNEEIVINPKRNYEVPLVKTNKEWDYDKLEERFKKLGAKNVGWLRRSKQTD
jgi:hypothetical protein